MKYAIPQDRLDKIVFRYLDMQYGNLEKVEGKNVDIVFKKPNLDSKYGVMGWKKSGILFIFYKLIKEISGVFSIEKIDSEKVIGRWVEDRYQIEAKDAKVLPRSPIPNVEDRHQIEVKDATTYSAKWNLMLKTDPN